MSDNLLIFSVQLDVKLTELLITSSDLYQSVQAPLVLVNISTNV